MNINHTIQQVCSKKWEWGKNDCLTLAEAVTGFKRPDWSCTKTENDARKLALENRDKEWDTVCEYLDETLERQTGIDMKPGDVVIPPRDVEWNINNGMLIIKPEFKKWAIGVLDESLSVVCYNFGRVVTFAPIGLRWRAPR